jgi:hypothetical protein
MAYDYDSDDCRAELDAYDRAELDADDYGYDDVEPTAEHVLTLTVYAPADVLFDGVRDEITSNVESIHGWSVYSIAAADTRLSMAAATVIVRALFRYVVGSFPSSDRVSTVAAVICDAVDADKSLSNLHTAYHAIKGEYRS